MPGTRRQPLQSPSGATLARVEPLIQSTTLWECHTDGSFTRRGGWSSRSAQAGPGRATEEVDGAAAESMPWMAGDGQSRPGVTLTVPMSAHGGTSRWLVTLGLRCAPDQPAALELWAPDSPFDVTLAWRTGWYSPVARPLAALSKLTRLLPGAGLPGLALELGSPAYFGRLESTDLFARSHCAQQIGLHHGLAIPVAGGTAVLAVMSGRAAPLAHRVEIAFAEGDDLRVVSGHCTQDGNLGLTGSFMPRAASQMVQALATDAPSLSIAPPGPHAARAVLVWPFQFGRGRRVAMALWL